MDDLAEEHREKGSQRPYASPAYQAPNRTPKEPTAGITTDP